MKKFFTICILLLITMQAGVLTAQTKQENFCKSLNKPFRHLSIGIEAGTTGVGFELGTNLHSHINMRAGFSIFPKMIKYSDNYSLDYDMSVVNELETFFPDRLAAAGINTDLIEPTVLLTGKPSMVNGKILFDFHPSAKSGFHFTAGLYFGSDRIITADGSLTEGTWKTINQLNKLLEDPAIPYQPIEIGVRIDNQLIGPDENGYIEAGIGTNKVKPYVGIGFGRTIPYTRFAFQFDMGTMIHGTPAIVSKNPGVADAINNALHENESTSSFMKTFKKVKVWPVLTFKFTYKIF